MHSVSGYTCADWACTPAATDSTGVGIGLILTDISGKENTD
jgi:hypothetical protein